MANWKDIKDKFAVDQLFGLYVKVLKNTPVYAYIDGYGKGILWTGWNIQSGSVAGKLYSWNDGAAFSQYGVTDVVDGIYLMFEGSEYTNYKNYYVKLEPGLIDWTFTKNQLDAQRKSNMAFYETWFDDLETNFTEIYQDYEKAIDNYIDTTKKTLVKVAVIGGIGLLAWTAWNSYFKYDLLLRQGAKYLKQR